MPVNLQPVNRLHIHFEHEPELVLNEGDCADGGDAQCDGGENAENEGVGVLPRHYGYVSVRAGGEVVDANAGASDVISRLFQNPFRREEDY